MALGLTVYTSHVAAEIPQSVSGEELPSLAPMIERTRPAVVNIATRGSIDIQKHPLLKRSLAQTIF